MTIESKFTYTFTGVLSSKVSGTKTLASAIMASRMKTPANLSDLVRMAFTRAREARDLHYFPTQVSVLAVSSIPFQLRFSPALANKPKAPSLSSSSNDGRKVFDPFANPPASLFLGAVGADHFLVLNKFAIVPEHFILATNEFKPQAHVLEASDLEATLACMEAYGRAEDELFAFFNSGPHSGASQPHRHIQLLPVARMMDGLAGAPWTLLASDLHALDQTPFMAFAEKVDGDSARLHAAYLRLYRRACRAVAQHVGDADALEAGCDDDVPAHGEATISYNMAMTRDTLVICPRLAEGAAVVDKTSGQVVGSLSLNGTLLAGTALVKNELEWEALQRDPEGLLSVLKTIGVPREGFREDPSRL